MSPVEKRTVSLHGHEVVYRVAGEPEEPGSRPVLLLVHGMAGSSAVWKAMLPRLGERYHVIAPDLPGHGESAKPRSDYSLGAYANTLRDLMIAVGVPSATVVGHSLGGGVVMQLAYQHPQRCQRLVLVSSGGLGTEVSWLLRAFTLPGTEYLMPVLFPGFVRDAGNAVSQAVARFGIRWAKAEQEWRAYASLTDPQNRHSFVRTLRAVIDPSGQSVSAHDKLYLARHLPTMIVWGTNDTIIPVSHAEAAHQAVPGSRLEILDGVGHFPPAEVPVQMTDIVIDFVDTTEPLELDDATWQAMLTEATTRPVTDAARA
jgi:pimeloyl-ACP methyl ester carboxylesterase